MILIPHLPLGNLASVRNMIAKCGGGSALAENPSDLSEADKIILAGVGSFDHGMASLREHGWLDALSASVLERRVPVLGICLGMQLLCLSSEEGKLPGLGWIDAQVKRFSLPENSDLKIPHMGWNTVDVVKPNPLIDADTDEQRFYFVHSYHTVCADPEDVLATAHHGYDFCAAFQRENIFGVQFHPEKSHRFGMAMMKRFVEMGA